MIPEISPFCRIPDRQQGIGGLEGGSESAKCLEFGIGPDYTTRESERLDLPTTL